MQIDSITEIIIGAAFRVHNELGFGFLEKVYENALVIELNEQGMKVEQQKQLPVFYKGKNVGCYSADLLIEDKVVIELKSCKAIAEQHHAQLLNYLKASGIEVGLLINFGKSVEVKRKVLGYS